MRDRERSSWRQEVFQGDYPEITWPALIVGWLIGVMLTASMTYTGLKIGFTIVGSEIAAILGFGILRGLMRRRSIVENNINQTIASGVNAASAGVIFTVPALYLQGVDIDLPVFLDLLFACLAGGILGVAFIIPVRKQMIDIDRLRFPSGMAVGAILKSPGAGIRKARLLGGGVAFGVLWVLFFYFVAPQNPEDPLLLEQVGVHLGLPDYVASSFALSVLSLGAGYITGQMGFTVLIGGVLAFWILAPIVVAQGWLPETVSHTVVRAEITRPTGIGMLVGGAVVGILLAFPSIKAAFAGLARARASAGGVERREELPIRVLYLAAILAFLALLVSAWTAGHGDISLGRSLFIALVGSLWLWLAGIVVAQCTGMTDWSPMSGLALVAVTLMLVLTGRQVVPSMAIGVAVCVAISQCADMMQDFRTGHIVGARPIRQQVVQFLSTWLGPIVALGVVMLLAQGQEIGSESLPAPQATALSGAMDAVRGGAVPWDKYVGGFGIGALLSLSGIHGLGVLVGLSMYLPLAYVLPYGLGCLLNILAKRFKGARWAEDTGIPVAAGLIVGESLTQLVINLGTVTAGFLR